MQGICRQDDGFVIFCNAALPGEKLLAEVSAVKKGECSLRRAPCRFQLRPCWPLASFRRVTHLATRGGGGGGAYSIALLLLNGDIHTRIGSGTRQLQRAGESAVSSTGYVGIGSRSGHLPFDRAEPGRHLTGTLLLCLSSHLAKHHTNGRHLSRRPSSVLIMIVDATISSDLIDVRLDWSPRPVRYTLLSF